ncbi:sigma factor, partial [Streptomyces sp. NPDC001940]
MGRTAKGSQEAFAAVYDRVAGPVFGVVRSVLRDHAQSEEVAQEVLIEVWRSAARYRPDRGTAMNWVLTLAHRRAIDRVRSVEASAARERQAAFLDRTPEFDEVTEQVEHRLEREQVRRCLGGGRGRTSTRGDSRAWSCPRRSLALPHDYRSDY